MTEQQVKDVLLFIGKKIEKLEERVAYLEGKDSKLIPLKADPLINKNIKEKV